MRQFERNCRWFHKVWNTWDDERFKLCFRISREIFKLILNKKGHHLAHDTIARRVW